ncbi:putative sieve element occlusion [Medicago truncatula]|uniref:Putative sieve element occlusion n=1 Tax=Medicago truncatula TaxID=3880 RepID=E2FKJ4_MEDTR|nr:protein SIEVE ELEMENT OCCLUSION B [Medicago truncatula]ADN32806.1 sieve element occlusion a [Medicago truncatula]AES61017.1 sieve element occlusion protein [Medicago truncatula]RHN80311.1 putative sieve element occlusion [Medicago truncatula]
MIRLSRSSIHIGNGDIIDHNPLTMSDEHILEEIYSTHVHSDTKFDAEYLFNIAGNILTRSTHVVDNFVQGHEQQTSLEQLDNINPPASFTSPLCTLKKINSEMACKAPGEEIAYRTTLAILNKLSNYSWVAKGVLTLSAFALEYGEFWLLSQYLPTEPLAKSLAIMKRVPQLTKPELLKKHRYAVLEVNNLIKATSQLIDIIIALERLNSRHDIKEVPALAPALEQFPVDVYWVIITIVAIVTQIECLTTDSEERQDLSQFGQKINIIISKLRKHVSQITIQIDEAEYNKLLKKLFQTPTEIMEVFKVLIFWKDTPQTPIYCGSTKTLVNIDVLKKKDVFLFISTLDICQEDISTMIRIYDHIQKTGSQHQIVWIPIVEEWNDRGRKKFDSLKSKMPWYVLHHFATIKGIRFIKEELHFKLNPLVVVLSTQGKILHQNAFHMIHVWGVKGFPFTKTKEESMTQELMWVDSVLVGIDIKIKWREDDIVIICGGKDKEWIQQFTKYFGALVNDATIKQTNTSIELICLESQQQNVVNTFWKKVESLFVTKMHEKTNSVTQQVEKLLSYKNESGWAIVTKGSIVIAVGHGTTVLKTFAEFGTWKGDVSTKGFEYSFREYHNTIASSVHICSHLEIPNVDGKIPDFIKCPDCHRTMEVYISYKCCHNG